MASIVVTSEEIKSIISTDITTFTVFEEMANALLDDPRFTYKEIVLKVIKLNLIAHFVTLKDRRASSQRVGETQVRYSTSFGMLLDSTEYGQTAKLFDRKGILTRLGKNKARITAVINDVYATESFTVNRLGIDTV